MCSSDGCAVVSHLSKQLYILKENVRSLAAGTCVPKLGPQLHMAVCSQSFFENPFVERH